MVIFEKFDTNQQYASANKIEVGGTIYVREECADQQRAEKDKEIKDLKEMNDWYKMWHNKFKKQIEDLTTELETYRPTRLKGEGQTKCNKCGDLGWTSFGYSRYKGQILCDKCLKEVLKKEKEATIEIPNLEELLKRDDNSSKLGDIGNEPFNEKDMVWTKRPPNGFMV